MAWFLLTIAVICAIGIACRIEGGIRLLGRLWLVGSGLWIALFFTLGFFASRPEYPLVGALMVGVPVAALLMLGLINWIVGGPSY